MFASSVIEFFFLWKLDRIDLCGVAIWMVYNVQMSCYHRLYSICSYFISPFLFCTHTIDRSETHATRCKVGHFDTYTISLIWFTEKYKYTHLASDKTIIHINKWKLKWNMSRIWTWHSYRTGNWAKLGMGPIHSGVLRGGLDQPYNFFLAWA